MGKVRKFIRDEIGDATAISIIVILVFALMLLGVVDDLIDASKESRETKIENVVSGVGAPEWANYIVVARGGDPTKWTTVDKILYSLEEPVIDRGYLTVTEPGGVKKSIKFYEVEVTKLE